MNHMDTIARIALASGIDPTTISEPWPPRSIAYPEQAEALPVDIKLDDLHPTIRSDLARLELLHDDGREHIAVGDDEAGSVLRAAVCAPEGMECPSGDPGADLAEGVALDREVVVDEVHTATMHGGESGARGGVGIDFSAITADQLRQLREETGLGLMDCKRMMQREAVLAYIDKADDLDVRSILRRLVERAR